MKSERAYLEHILHCIARIREDSASGRDAVFQSATLQDAILRNLQVLCESAQRLSEASKRAHPGVNWRGIAGMRNVLVHDYFVVDFEVVWQVVERDLRELEVTVVGLLEDQG